METDPASRRPSPWSALDTKRPTEKRAKDAPPRAAPDANKAGHSADEADTASPAWRLCVLEDSYSNLRLMLRMFHERGYHADHFTNLDYALESLARGDYDALIVSDTMAGGAEACQTAITRVRGHANKAAVAVPILAITRHDDAGRSRVLEVLGATETLSDLTETHLAGALASLFEKSRARATAESAPAPAALREPRVLLLEDSYSLSLVLANALMQAKRAVDHVTTLDQAVAALNQHAYETVIVSQDDRPGPMSCVQFVEHARFAQASGDTPPRVWVLTADLAPDNVNGLRRAGAERVLPKHDPAQLGATLVDLFDGKDVTQVPDGTNRLVADSAMSRARARMASPMATAANAAWLKRLAWPTWGYLALVAALFAGGWTVWHTVIDTIPVDVVAARRGTLELTIGAHGVVVSKRQVNLPPAQAGQLHHVFINEGDLVRKGETLATLDNREATINVRRAEAQVFRLRTESNVADKALQAARAAGATEAPEPALAAAESARAVARAQLRVAEQDLQAAKLALERLAIVAPFAGVVTRSLAVDGKWVEPGEPLFTLADFSAREVELRLPVDVAQNVGAGMTVKFSVENDAREQWQEQVARVVSNPNAGNALGMRAQTTLYATLGDDAPALQLGQRVTARIVTDAVTDTIVAPSEAVFERAGKHYVAIADDERVVIRPVQLGLQNDNDVALRSGVSVNESIILSRTPLEDGQRVVVRQSALDGEIQRIN